ncbi:hypothetical protein PR002_g33032 [Phytophthora rubi]|uniref:Uncharacterized protein n=1 Tax=Phytophthora rubi TaxID=129364 RepID=A0A6A3FYM0_9STRA|nr:hypothetical protein PR002_g33032 [Phytophthora rubi]
MATSCGLFVAAGGRGANIVTCSNCPRTRSLRESTAHRCMKVVYMLCNEII